mmetsp:Transcript_792/g.1902  ORF Transcript_792/g.1902 Transcript_792/m.1902 type:complete len:275 (+) Transcript_792:1310-2134(+)
MRAPSSPGTVRRSASWSSGSIELEMPLGYTTDVPRPSGSSQTWCVRPGNLLYLDSSDGQYLGSAWPPALAPDGPSKTAPRPDLTQSATSASVSAVVRVPWQLICLAGGAHAGSRSLRKENGAGEASPGCSSVLAQSMVSPSSLGGVPVLRRPSRNPCCSSSCERDAAAPAAARSGPEDARPAPGSPRRAASAVPLPRRPAGRVLLPTWITPLRKVPVVTTTARQPMTCPLSRTTPETSGRSWAPRRTSPRTAPSRTSSRPPRPLPASCRCIAAL